jgi:hypothetical protein
MLFRKPLQPNTLPVTTLAVALGTGRKAIRPEPPQGASTAVESFFASSSLRWVSASRLMTLTM